MRMNAHPPGGLLGAFADQHDLGRLNNDGEVKEHGKMLDVEKVIFELGFGLLQAGAVNIANLGPAGEAGTDAVALVEEGNFAIEHLAEVGHLRPGTDQAHLTTQSIDELGQFVQPELADDGPNAGNAGITICGPGRLLIASAYAHGAELKDLKDVPAEPDAVLLEQDRASIL